ncbi:hypothetical protein L1887_58906 [Cichorium endivia]|nr:hypothetical protein L1887_58906 [Cichorium endivia]
MHDAQQSKIPTQIKNKRRTAAHLRRDSAQFGCDPAPPCGCAGSQNSACGATQQSNAHLMHWRSLSFHPSSAIAWTSTTSQFRLDAPALRGREKPAGSLLESVVGAWSTTPSKPVPANLCLSCESTSSISLET